MAAKPKKPFLLRINPKTMGAVERLAAAELRSTNAQMEILILEALKKRGISIENIPDEVNEEDAEN